MTDKKVLNPYSREVTEGDHRAPNRAMLRAVGFTDSDFGKPIVALANAHSTITPCNAGLGRLATAAEQAIREALPAFIGEIEQVPPKFSAIKVGGERAYDLAREGEEFELEARPVTVHDASLVSVEEGVRATFHVRSGKGFYVRALARDLAHALGTEGHITELRRTRVGVFEEANAVTIAELEALAGNPEGLMDMLAPIETVMGDIPLVDISGDDAREIFNGQPVMLLPYVVEHWQANRSSKPEDNRLAVAMDGDRAVALGEVRAGRFQPVRVFAG